MQYAAKTSSFRMTPNMTTLNGAIDDSVTTIIVSADVFSNGNIIVVGGEQITLGTSGDGLTYTGCTRDGGEGAEAHADGQEASLYGGTAIVSHTYDGTTYLNVYHGSANVEAMFVNVIDGVEILRSRTGSDNTDYCKPVARYQPGDTVVISIGGFLKHGAVTGNEAEFSACLQS